MNFGLEITIILLMLTVNALFAAFEMALASISKERLEALKAQNKKGSDAALYMKNRMEASLAVVQLGITLAGAIAAAIGGAGAQDSFAPYFMEIGISEFYAEALSIICIVIPLSVFTIIFAELVPKMFAINNREWVCLTFSPYMKFIAMIAGPAVMFFETVVKKIMALGPKKTQGQPESMEEKFGLSELKAAAALARTSKLIGAYEEKIVLSAAMLSVKKVSDIMLDEKDISMIYASCNFREALIKAHMDMHTRFPVCAAENDPQTIEGYITFKDIVSAVKMKSDDQTIKRIMRPIKSIKHNMSLSDALSEMVKEKTHIALVKDSDNKTAGLLTIEDIIEELVGNIEDEYDKLPAFIDRYGNGLIVGGAVLMKNIFVMLGIEDKKNAEVMDVTLSDWVSQRVKKNIMGGEIIKKGGLLVAVRKLRRKRVSEAFVSVARDEKKQGK